MYGNLINTVWRREGTELNVYVIFKGRFQHSSQHDWCWTPESFVGIIRVRLKGKNYVTVLQYLFSIITKTFFPIFSSIIIRCIHTKYTVVCYTVHMRTQTCLKWRNRREQLSSKGLCISHTWPSTSASTDRSMIIWLISMGEKNLQILMVHTSFLSLILY